MSSERPPEPSLPRISVTSPLGGRLHLPSRRDAVRRQWSGYVAYVRACPECGWENQETHLFCVNCARDIRDAPIAASEDARAGLDLLNRRLARDQLSRTRTRVETSHGGGGWIVVGGILVLISIYIQADPLFQFLSWSGGIALVVSGIWQMRRDGPSLRRWGMILSLIATSSLVLIGYRALSAPEPDRDSAITGRPPTAVSQVATPAAAPLAGSVGPAIEGEVAMYRGGPLHNGQLPGPPPASNPRLAWRFDTGGEVYSSPAIADGIIYVASKSGFLHAIDAGSGTEIWRVTVSNYVTRSSPAVVDGTVYIGGGFAFLAIDAKTGQERWRVPVQYSGQATPTVAGGIVVVSSQEGYVFGIDAKSGEVKWRSPTDGVTFGTPAIAGTQVVFGTDAGIFYSLELSTGKLHWRTPLAGAIFASPAIMGSSVLIPTQASTLLAIDLKTGDELWRAAQGGAETPAVTSDLVVLAASDGGVYGLDFASGVQRWLYPSGKRSVSAPVISGDAIIAGSGNTLLALDPATGKPKWYYLANDIIETSPVVLDGYVFFGSRDGFLYAVTDRPEAQAIVSSSRTSAAAASVVSMSASLCADERKSASNCDGAR